MTSNMWHCEPHTHWEQCNCENAYMSTGVEECKDAYCLGRMEKCPNFDFCGGRNPVGWMHCWGGRCSSCDLILYRNLTFTRQHMDCPICFETRDQSVIFPGCVGNHSTCIPCLRIIYQDYFKKRQPTSVYSIDHVCPPYLFEDIDDDDERVVNQDTFPTCPLCRSDSTPTYMK